MTCGQVSGMVTASVAGEVSAPLRACRYQVDRAGDIRRHPSPDWATRFAD